MALTHLLDTSVVQRLRRSQVREVVEPLAAAGQLGRRASASLRWVTRRGRTIPDLLVAAAAEELDVAVLHYDADFDLIALVTGQPTQRVVPAGTVE